MMCERDDLRMTPYVPRRPTTAVALIAALLSLALIIAFAGPSTAANTASSTAGPTGYWHTNGSKILDASGKEVHVNGIAWFGLETSNYAPHGLWQESMSSLLDKVKGAGFNFLRVPFSTQMFDSR